MQITCFQTQRCAFQLCHLERQDRTFESFEFTAIYLSLTVTLVLEANKFTAHVILIQDPEINNNSQAEQAANV